MRKSLLFLAFALIFACSSVMAGQGVSITSVTGTYPTNTLPDAQLNAAAGLHTLTISWDGTGLSGKYLTTNNWLIHGSADWQSIVTERVGILLRAIVEGGTLDFGVTPQHMGWHKVGGSGDPNFGAPGLAAKEDVNNFADQTAGPHAGNGTGTDTVGILIGLTSTGPGWEPAVNTSGPVLTVKFFTSTADNLKTFCIDSVSQPLGAWEWAMIGGASIGPAWDNGLGNGNTRCWEVFEVPHQPPFINNCSANDNQSFSHCTTPQLDFDADLFNGASITSWDIAGTSTAGGTIDINGVWNWPGPPQSGNYVLDVTATDDQGGTSLTCSVNITVTNIGPTIACPGGSVTAPLDITKSQTVVTGDDCDALTITAVPTVAISGAIVINGNDIEYTAAAGDELIGNVLMDVTVSDGELTASCQISWDVIAGSPYSVRIDKLHDVIQGQFWDVDLILGGIDANAGLGGFDLLIAYDNSALSFQQALEGDIYAECGWEYFTYRFGANGNCSGGCPSGLVRVIGIAETNNGPNHPEGCLTTPYAPDLSTSTTTLASLRFLVSNDRTLECQFVPIRFFWIDCGDNTLSNADGSELYLSAKVFEYVNDIDLFAAGEMSDGTVGFPTYQGAQDGCVHDDPLTGKIAKRNVDFQNGGIDIVCADSIDARGDINLNGLAYEIADAVMFTNYFVSGLSAFGTHQNGSVAASDVNADGLSLTVADLVYLIRVVVGDASPMPKVSPMAAAYSYDNGTVAINAEMGAAFIVVEGNRIPKLIATNMDMKYDFDGVNTRVLVYSTEANETFNGEFISISGDMVTAEFATYEGQPVASKIVPTSFSLEQNYPNPFNPTTKITFSLTEQSSWQLNVYNVTGQLVEAFNGNDEAGIISVDWNAEGLATGIYFYKLTAGNNTQTKKAVLLK